VLAGFAPWVVVHGDALRLLARLPDECVDAVICDPPYASGGGSATARKRPTSQKYVGRSSRGKHPDFLGDSRDQRSYLAWCVLWLGECWRVLRPGGVLAAFADWRQYPTVSDALQCAGFTWRGVIAWDKTPACRPQPGRPRQQAEFVLWGSRGDLPLDRDAAVIDGVVRCRVDPDERHHQTSKPLALMSAVVELCIRGGVVLDPFAGSGTTGLAAVQSGRRFVGFELSAHYAEVARARMAGEARTLGESSGQAVIPGVLT
jgi:site-specific DNA-methyltransferase (adenine-specific)